MELRKTLWRPFLSPRYPAALLISFLIWFGVWAIRPPHPGDFILEHIFTAVFLVFLVLNHARFRFSNLSYSLIFTFLSLHVVGAHYTYSEVPYDAWSERLASFLGVEGFRLNRFLGFTRNHFDRLVHFAFGLLMAYPVREVFIRVARVKGFWGYYLPLDVMMSFSMLYELIEWAVAVIVAGDVGQSYLGTQGDEWDAHKDMALATLGAVLAMTTTGLLCRRLKRDFAAEFIESLKGDPRPLGEVRIAELIAEEAERMKSSP